MDKIERDAIHRVRDRLGSIHNDEKQWECENRICEEFAIAVSLPKEVQSIPCEQCNELLVISEDED